ncbi:MAG: hypothetical protein Q7R64_02140 [bacterium]|nr:hypothetical protein [bacterium]
MNTLANTPTLIQEDEESLWFPQEEPPRFILGDTYAQFEVTVAIPREAMLKAFKKHYGTTPIAHDAPVKTEHEWNGRVFIIETMADHRSTLIGFPPQTA